jgi:hypothetical protein
MILLDRVFHNKTNKIGFTGLDLYSLRYRISKLHDKTEKEKKDYTEKENTSSSESLNFLKIDQAHKCKCMCLGIKQLDPAKSFYIHPFFNLTGTESKGPTGLANSRRGGARWRLHV